MAFINFHFSSHQPVPRMTTVNNLGNPGATLVNGLKYHRFLNAGHTFSRIIGAASVAPPKPRIGFAGRGIRVSALPRNHVLPY